MSATAVLGPGSRGWLGSLRRQLPVTGRLVGWLRAVAAPGVGGIVVWRLGLVGDLAVVVLALAVAFAVTPSLADSAASLLASSPTTRAQRAVARLALVVPLGALGLVVARAVALRHVAGGGAVSGAAAWVPTGDEWLLAAALIGAALAVESAVSQGASGSGHVGAAATLVGCGVALWLPARMAVFPVEAHRWVWAAVLSLSIVTMAVALADPGRTRPNARRTVRREADRTVRSGRGRDER